MKEFNIPYSEWESIPLEGSKPEKGVGFFDLLRALRYKAYLEKEEYERIKEEARHGTKQPSRTIRFE